MTVLKPEREPQAAPAPDAAVEELRTLLARLFAAYSDPDPFGVCRATATALTLERYRGDAETLLAGLAEALAETGRLKAAVAEYESAAAWNTSCLDCARLLNLMTTETLRRERAEARLARAIEERGPVRWLVSPGYGGMVCAVPDPSKADGICGMPVESEPCSIHRTPAWRAE